MDRLLWGTEAAGVNARDITIEVLENTDFGVMSETSPQVSKIGELRRAGFDVMLDDFGVGFAGLSHLTSLDVSGVKIDRSLITDLMTDDVSMKVVRKIIELASDLGLKVIAEGVEDEHVADALRNMGCRVIQGYWLAPPIPADHINDWLLAHDAAPWVKSA